MEEWKLDSEITDSETSFKKQLDRAIYLTKFTAITAKRILEASENFKVDSETLMDGVREWIEQIKNGGNQNEKI